MPAFTRRIWYSLDESADEAQAPEHAEPATLLELDGELVLSIVRADRSRLKSR